MALSHCHPNASHQPGECIVCDGYEQFITSGKRFTHCDAYVTHRPGECKQCDEYSPDLQQWRLDNDINFTGETDAAKLPCPATQRRDIKKIHAWGGNYPRRPSCKKCGDVAVYINLALACPKHGPI